MEKEDKNCKLLNWIIFNAPQCRLVYWLVIFVALTVYVVCNWAKVTTFTFFTNFNGENIIFLLWIALLLIPLITSLKVFNTEIAFWAEKENNDARKEAIAKLEKEYSAKETKTQNRPGKDK